MNNHDKIKQAFKNITAPDNISEKITQKHQRRNKFSTFKPAKIIASAAVLVLIAGLINIQTVMAFISGLFFVPLVGFIPDENAVVLMHDSNEPVYIQCDGKNFKLERAVKVISDNINFTYFEIGTNDVNMTEGLFSYDITLYVKDNGEIKEVRLVSGGASANYGRGEKGVYERWEQGFVENLSDSTEIEVAINTSDFVTLKFDVTEDMLTYGTISEINGITFTAMMKKDDYSKIDLAYFSSAADSAKYRFSGRTFDIKVYAEDGSVIPWYRERAWDNYYTTDILNNNFSMSTIQLDNPENKKIVSIKTDCINASYSPKNGNNGTFVEIPVPADGETFNSDIKFSFGGGESVIMSKIERKGDTLFYDMPEIYLYMYPEKEKALEEREKAVKRKEILLTGLFHPYGNGVWLENNMMEKTITGITDDMKTVMLEFFSIHVSYFGNWEINFIK